jgi:hypothetical protein
MGPTKYEHNNQLITLTVITLSGFHCIRKLEVEFTVITILRYKACRLPE